MKALVDVCSFLESEGIPVGELSPENLIVNSDGEINLINTYLLNGVESSVQKLERNPNYQAIYSPEQLKRLELGIK